MQFNLVYPIYLLPSPLFVERLLLYLFSFFLPFKIPFFWHFGLLFFYSCPTWVITWMTRKSPVFGLGYIFCRVLFVPHRVKVTFFFKLITGMSPRTIIKLINSLPNQVNLYNFYISCTQKFCGLLSRVSYSAFVCNYKCTWLLEKALFEK